MSTNEGNGGRGKRRRTKEERGLPSDVAALELAKVYLEEQTALWPEAVRAGFVPNPTPENIEALARDFQARFVSDEPPSAAELPRVADSSLAASYVRFSDDSSNPRSLAQQLRLQLIRARENTHWIAWQNVYADAGVTGKDASRIGYMRAKSAIGHPEFGIQTLYIDEVGRASRDAIEALMLGEFITEHEKRLVGVSDGFDSTRDESKTMLHLYAMLQQWFVDQLGTKVKRGMDYAFDMGASTGLPAVGYKLVPLKDANGNQMHGKDGAVTKTLAIDDTMKKFVLLAFLLFTERHVSPERIAKYFNRRRVGGSTSWDGSRVRQLLKRHIYVGMEAYVAFYNSPLTHLESLRSKFVEFDELPPAFRALLAPRVKALVERFCSEVLPR